VLQSFAALHLEGHWNIIEGMSKAESGGGGSTAFTDGLSKQIGRETAKTAFELVWGLVKRIGMKAVEEAQVRQAMAQYAENYQERHGQVKLFGAATPIPLHQIYTEARIVRSNYLSEFTDPKAMEQAFRDSGRKHGNFQAETERLDAVQVANENQYLNLLGAPGAGKSTFLSQLGQKALLSRAAGGQLWETLRGTTAYGHAKLPVLIELRRFKSEPIDLVALIVKEFATCQFPESRAFVEGALKEGGLLILLDGLDEVPEAKLTEVIEQVRDFVDRYGERGAEGNRFVTSCRTAHYKSFFRKFTDVVLADFSDEQIEQFAQNRFRSADDLNDQTADKFLTELRRPENAGSLELARTPLLLGFLCVTFDHRQELPGTRSSLYRRALDILLREWSASKRVHDEPVYKELNTDLEVDLLAEMAESLFREDRFFFTREEAKKQIREFMGKVLNAPKTLDADQILTAIEVHQGLIVKRAQDSYSFSHLTIQEYLAAKKIWEGGEKMWGACVEDHLFEERWAVVFELMSGMGKADELLLAMAARCQRRLADAEEQGGLGRWLGWLREQAQPCRVLECDEVQKMAATRSLFLALAHCVAIDHDGTRSHEAARAGFGLNVISILALAHDQALYLALSLAHHLDLTLSLACVHARDRDIELALDLIRVLIQRGIVMIPAIMEKLQKAERLAKSACKQSWADKEKAYEKINRILELPLANEIMDFGTHSRSLEGLILISLCRKAAYHLSAEAWEKVCAGMLMGPEKAK